MSERARRIAVLAALAYVPLLASAPGRVPGDTKLGLYLNPGRLISDSIWSWDARQLGGWVPHQNVGYLWPSGPFYALFDFLGVPDWVTHRLWTGTLLLLAGLGVAWLARILNLSPTVGVCAAVIYQLSPYVLPYISRTSALLLPWSLLGWIIGVTIGLARRRDRRLFGVFGLLVASTGGLNATALAMIAPAPLIFFFAYSRGQSMRRRALTLGTLGIVSIGASAWWLAGLRIQGSFGAPVLSYSETLPSTAATSTSLEVLRGLGYWLFYDRNHVVALTSAATPYMGSLIVMLAGITIAALGIWGLRSLPTDVRRPLMITLLAGVVLAIGAYPFTDPSPLWKLAADNPTSALSLALRSSTRAVPLVILALAFGAGSTLERLVGRRTTRAHILAPALAVGLAVMNLPALVGGRLVDPVMERPNDLPRAWYDAADYLDHRYDDGHIGAVLLVPGMESAAYRWGYTVDPILPSLTKKPLVTRDWLPLGSAPYMDLLYAFDDAIQNGGVDPASIAPVARWLGADTVMVVRTEQYERFGTAPTPPDLSAAPGLTHLADFGRPAVNTSRFWSTTTTIDPPEAGPEISLYSVDDASPDRVVTSPLVVFGDGSGLVDIAPFVDGPVLAAAALDPDTLERALADASEVVVTDSNRRRAHHWRSSQEVWGATEPLSGTITTSDVFDQRLPVFPGATSDDQTIVSASDITARATSYGYELTYRPESRPTMAIDGDLTTAWTVGERRDPRGQILTVEARDPLRSLELVPAATGRTITRASVRVDGGDWKNVDIAGNTGVALDSPGRVIEIRIDAVAGDENAAVGWAEVVPADRSRPEFVRVPRTNTLGNVPVTYAFTRLTADRLDPWRSDPETAIRRDFDVSSTSTFDLTLVIRADPTVGFDDLPHVTASSSLARAVNPWLALDGDASTAWFPSPADADPTLGVPIDASEIVIHSTRDAIVTVRANGQSLPVATEGPTTTRVSIPAGVDTVDVSISPRDRTPMIDARTGDEVVPPVGVSEIDGARHFDTDARFESECRNDLLTIDGRPLPIRISGTISDLVLGRPLATTSCSAELQLDPGVHRLEATPGRVSGFDLDTILVRSSPATATSASTATTEARRVESSVSRDHRSYSIPPCPNGCWLETHDGWNVGWTATLDGVRLGAPIASGAGRSSWWLEPSTNDRTVEASWSPQGTMWWGLGTSAVTLVACLVLLAIRRRGIELPGSAPGETNPTRLWLATTAVTAVVVGPVWAIVPLAFTRRLFARWAWRVGVALLALTALFLLAQQVRTGAPPGFGWPSVFRRAHRPALLGIVLAVAGSWPSRRVTHS